MGIAGINSVKCGLSWETPQNLQKVSVHGGVSHEKVDRAFSYDTGDMLNWEILKLPPKAVVTCLGQKGKVTIDTDVGFLNPMLAFFPLRT